MLVSGPEALFADRAWNALRSQLREAAPDVEIHDIDGSEYTGGELFSLASPSLFGEPRLIRVTNAEKCSDDFITDAKRYLEAPDDTTTLVIRHGGGVRGKAVLDAVRGGAGDGLEIVCAEIKPKDRPAFMQQEIRRLGLRVDPGAASMLLDAFQERIEELAAVLTQLAESGKERITEADVEHHAGGRVEAGAFRLADAAVAGKGAEALVLLRQTLAGGTAPIPLLAALNMKVRAMAKVFGAKGPSGAMARELGMAPWQVDRAMKDLRGWREHDLARVLDAGAETDLALKGGARDPGYALERYVLLVASKGKR